MLATECRAKAHEALSQGATAIDPKLTLAWEGVAQQWVALANQAEIQETWRRNFLGQEPH
jgi:hypothetical protein